ncbi:LuxR C-terminal-related transcriptional regulator [Arthrobacter sp. W4I7]|uniref:LuxR C-terminal-related transcriptional regulator n=1 Tax=Arthrobacter sp. W4I7 TaxID=3042296 RepID=UPI002787DA14|nr:LuxR C-terminal-related transcriptional regulator [Arthrobacter sp. W4I7]MDQ0689287.1 LuxR family maltose regulon positive regulatory protein [Arthrobacter sp. W4I7]
MARPLIATKLFVPKVRSQVVTRARLLERLRRGADVRLTLVSAPAGFGKTTLLAQWLGTGPDNRAHERPDERRVAWVSLDATDKESSSFWTYVVSALQGAVPGVGSSALESLASPAAPVEGALTTLVNDLAAAPSEVWLVLDDYHLVDNPEVGKGLAFLLEHLPPNIHVIISTRADPGLPLSRWRARGELVEVRAAELRFTSQEAAAYFNEAAGLGLSEAEVAALEQRTEGWVAALQLAALSLQGRADIAGFVAGFAGNDRYIVDYLVEEVLEHQSQEVRNFLLNTSVLDRLSGPLCDAVTGGGDGSWMLTALERANLFLVPLDDRRECFRYHHLFADVLRARLLSQQPGLVPLLHERASLWYEHNALTDEAVRHALAGQDFGRAAHLMELAVPVIRRERQESLLFGWLKALPDDVVRRSPVLSVFYGFMLMATGDLQDVEARFEDADVALAAVPPGHPLPWADTEELRALPATIAVYRASLAQARGDVAGTAEHARRALELAGPNDHLSRGAAAGFLGLAAWVGGDVESALETFTQAVESLHASGNLVDALSSTVILADMWLAAGRPGQARRLYLDGLRLAESLGDRVARATAELHVGLSEIECEAGDPAGAEGHLREAAAFFDRSPMTESRYRWFVARALTAWAGGSPDDAVGLLDQAEQLYRRGFFPEVRPIAAMKARIRIAQGELAEAGDWARARRLSVTDDVNYLSEFDHLTLVRLLIAQLRGQPDDGGANDEAARLLERLLESAAANGRAGSIVEIRMLQALLEDVHGHRQRARDMLGRAFTEVPEPGGYARLFLAEGAPMLGLLRDAVEHGTGGDHPRRLLSMVPPADAEAPDQGHEPPGPDRQASTGAVSAAEKLSGRELQVLRLLDSELSGPEIARALFISHNTLRTHTKHIFAKLGVSNRQGAVRRARERRLM